MKRVYICGDSFCVSDSLYGPMWADMVAQHYVTQNLAEVSCTNLLIARQVDQAIAHSAGFVIVNFTAVTRGEKRVDGQYVPFSYHTASEVTTPFDDQQLRILKEYYTEFFDLDLAIYQNAITIEHTIQKLINAGIPFLFDQGGFEHHKFGAVGTYFEQYASYRSLVNLWNYSVTREYRPYYHIIDQNIHHNVAEYYIQQIGKHIL